MPIYRAQCGNLDVEEIAALDPPTAARVHAERLYKRGLWPCTGGKLPEPLDTIVVHVHDPVSQRIDAFTVRRRMQPVFEVVT